MRRFVCFWWLCAKKAFWGNTAFANDWQWVFGIPVCSGVVAWIAARQGAATLSTGNPIADAFLVALTAFVITWCVAFLVRLLNAPVILCHERGRRIEELESLAGIAPSNKPSFELGFEVSVDPLEIVTFNAQSNSSFKTFASQDICRIWVKNLEHRPYEECRLTLESLRPNSPVKNGVLLFPDNRGSEEEPQATFYLAATEKRYFKFLRLSKPIISDKLAVVIKSDQDRRGFGGVLHEATLAYGSRYFATIAVHGKNAGSARLNLTIDLNSEYDIRVRPSDDDAVTAE